MTARRADLDFSAMALMVLLCLCWGLQQVMIKLAVGGIPPILQAGLRSVVACGLVWLWVALRGGGPRLTLGGAAWRPGIGAGLLFALEFCLLYEALAHTSAARAVLFLYSAPFVVALGTHWLVPGERLRPMQGVGLVCAFAGVALALGDGLHLADPAMLLGDALALAAGIAWGATTVLVRASPLIRQPATQVLFYQLAVSAIALPLASLGLGESWTLSLTPMVGLAFAYQAVAVAFASYLAWFWLVGRYPAGKLSVFSFLTPLFGMAAGGLLLGERLSPALGGALVLVAAGIVLVNRRPAGGGKAA